MLLCYSTKVNEYKLVQKIMLIQMSVNSRSYMDLWHIFKVANINECLCLLVRRCSYSVKLFQLWDNSVC